MFKMKTLLFVIAFFASGLALCAPNAVLLPYWDNSDEKSTISISHEPLSDFLKKYTQMDERQNRLVRYSEVSDGDKERLFVYISHLSELNPLRYNRNEQFAFWVNLYNALTVRLILENYPIKSITKLGGFFSFGPWDQEIVEVNNKELTLNDIEHRILRPIWQDKRIHYVVNCASKGCPNIGASAFSSSDINQQLDEAARIFINSKKGVFLKGDGEVLISSIYDWYQDDFGDRRQLIKHLDNYLTIEKRAKLPLTMSTEFSFDYDWLLNE